jgi:hypothetical protein
MDVTVLDDMQGFFAVGGEVRLKSTGLKDVPQSLSEIAIIVGDQQRR